jgi:cell division transport system ATP-binding protein
VFGRDTSALSARDRALLRRQIGVIIQAPWFIEHLSVRENAAIAPRVTGRRTADYDSDVAELLAWVGLAKQAEALPAALSPGERRRLALARAVANRPELLLADEPAGDLEPAEGARVLKLLSEIHRAGTTVLMASADQTLAVRSGYPVLHLQGGRIGMLEPALYMAPR